MKKRNVKLTVYLSDGTMFEGFLIVKYRQESQFIKRLVIECAIALKDRNINPNNITDLEYVYTEG